MQNILEKQAHILPVGRTPYSIAIIQDGYPSPFYEVLSRKSCLIQ